MAAPGVNVRGGRHQPACPRDVLSTSSILVVLMVIVLAAWFTIGSHIRIAGPRIAEGTTAARFPAGVLATPEGVYQAIRTFSQVRRKQFLTEAEVGTYLSGHPTAARLAVFQHNSVSAPATLSGRVVLLVVRVTDAVSAQRIAGRLDRLQLRSVQLPSSTDDARPTVARTHYASGPLVVRVGVTSSDRAMTVLQSVLEQQLRILPADA